MSDQAQNRVLDIEKEIDSLYLNQALHKRGNRSLAAWHLMLVHEEILRLPILKPSPKNLSVDRVHHRIEHAKGALQYALQWISSLPESALNEKKPLEQIVYGEAWEMMNLADSYYGVVGPFTLFNRRDATAKILDDSTVHFERDEREIFFDILDNISQSVESPALEMYKKLPILFLNEFDAITKTARQAGADKVVYQVTHKELRPIVRYIDKAHQSSTHVTEEWDIAGISAGEIRKVFAALRVLTMVHTLAVGIAVRRFAIRGAAQSSALLTYSRESWIAIISKNSEVAPEAVAQIIDFCTYDWSLAKRDISLQPFVRIWKGSLTVCPYLIVGSDLERNFRTLMARTRKTEYDKISKVFEERMVERCAALAEKFSLRFRSGVRIPGRKDLPDIDAVFASEQESCLFLCQLKAVIPPSEPSEIKERAKRELEGLDQVGLLKKFDSENPGAIAKTCFSEMELPRFVLHLVIMQGYVGSAQCIDHNVPVVELTMFENEMERLQSLKAVLDYFSAWRHLPKEGVDFERRDLEITIGDYRVIWGAYSLAMAPRGEGSK